MKKMIRMIRILAVVSILLLTLAINAEAKHLSAASSIEEAMKIAQKHGIKFENMAVESTSYAKYAVVDGKTVQISGNYTASGNPFIPGFSIAVDPYQIELGSILYVDGYGWGMAADKGKAVTWGIIDVSFIWAHHSDIWGRQPGCKILNFGKGAFSSDQIQNLIKIKKEYVKKL